MTSTQLSNTLIVMDDSSTKTKNHMWIWQLSFHHHSNI